MIKFKRPAGSLRGVILQLSKDGHTVTVEAGTVRADVTQAALDAYVAAGTLPAALLETVADGP